MNQQAESVCFNTDTDRFCFVRIPLQEVQQLNDTVSQMQLDDSFMTQYSSSDFFNDFGSAVNIGVNAISKLAPVAADVAVKLAPIAIQLAPLLL